MPLPVAGAFHTQHMAPAVGHVAELAASVSVHDPRIPLISNRDGQVIHDGREVLKRIIGQIASPVRWDLCMETMADLGVTGILEMPPAGTLTGIAKRALKGVDTFALKTPDQLDDARAFCDKHGEGSLIDDHADVADGRLPRQGHLPRSTPRPPTPTCSLPASRSARQQPARPRRGDRRPRRPGRRVARGGRRPGLARSAAAAPAPRGGRVTARGARHGTGRRRTPPSSASAPTDRARIVPTPSSSRPSTAATSGSSSAPASSSAACCARTRRCR